MNEVEINNMQKSVAKVSIAEFKNSKGVPTIRAIVKTSNPRNIIVKFFFIFNVFVFLISVVSVLVRIKSRFRFLYFLPFKVCEELSARISCPKSKVCQNRKVCLCRIADSSSKTFQRINLCLSVFHYDT